MTVLIIALRLVWPEKTLLLCFPTLEAIFLHKALKYAPKLARTLGIH